MLVCCQIWCMLPASLELPVLHASGGMQPSGAVLAQTVWGRNGRRLIGEVLLHFTSSVALSLNPELCHSPALAQPHPCWSQPWSSLPDLTSEVSSLKLFKLEGKSYCRWGKYCWKILTAFSRCWTALGIPQPCQRGWQPLPLSLQNGQVLLLLNHLVWLYLVRNYSHAKPILQWEGWNNAV